ncbi:nitroreductase family protein [Deinococcus cavernae]|uniref:nitroreductase family protein n=1 Tax=Deinococcus cavernae TaxID=2320857 RepID=UPI001314A579|nr:nitroreductase [Deinococcus cavernae]
MTAQTAPIVLDTIRQRRTIDLLKLKPDPVPQDVLEAILTAATWAPTHGKHQPWRFTVFTGEGRRQLADLFARAYAASSAKDAGSPDAQENQRMRVMRAPVWISLELHVPQPPRFPQWEEEHALAAAAQNMLLAATAFGLASKWVSGVAMISPLTAHELGAPELRGFIFLGYAAEQPKDSTRTPLEEKVVWVRD